MKKKSAKESQAEGRTEEIRDSKRTWFLGYSAHSNDYLSVAL